MCAICLCFIATNDDLLCRSGNHGTFTSGEIIALVVDIDVDVTAHGEKDFEFVRGGFGIGPGT